MKLFINPFFCLKGKKSSLKITKCRVGGVPGNLVLGGNTYQALHRSESNIGGSGLVTLIIHYYLYSFILPHCHTWIRCTQIDPNRWALSLLVGHCYNKFQDLFFRTELQRLSLFPFFFGPWGRRSSKTLVNQNEVDEWILWDYTSAMKMLKKVQYPSGGWGRWRLSVVNQNDDAMEVFSFCTQIYFSNWLRVWCFHFLDNAIDFFFFFFFWKKFLDQLNLKRFMPQTI